MKRDLARTTNRGVHGITFWWRAIFVDFSSHLKMHGALK
jgi:hypothetical protein